MEREKLKHKSRQEALKDTQDQIVENQKRQDKLIDYMQSVTTEEWAKKNFRVAEYVEKQIIRETIKRQALQSAQATRRDSFARVGFAGANYAPIDLAGTNEISRPLSIDGISFAPVSKPFSK